MYSSMEMFELICNTGTLRYKIIEKVAKEFYLAPIEVEILAVLYIYPHVMTATDIEKQKAIKKNTISVHVENLVEMGFLERVEHKGDRRKVKLALSDKAKSIAAKIKTEYDLLARKLGEGLSEEEIAVQDHCLEIIALNAKKLLAEREG